MNHNQQVLTKTFEEMGLNPEAARIAGIGREDESREPLVTPDQIKLLAALDRQKQEVEEAKKKTVRKLPSPRGELLTRPAEEAQAAPRLLGYDRNTGRPIYELSELTTGAIARKPGSNKINGGK